MSAALALDERQALRDEALKWALNAYDDKRRRTALASPEGYDSAAWRELAELGWLGLAIAEDFGGAGASTAELAAVAEAVGAGLLAEPVSMVAGIAAEAIGRLGSDAQKRHDLPRLADGSLIVSLAHLEPEGGYDREVLETRAEAGAQGFVLTGAKAAVEAGEAADVLLVSARDAQGRLGLYRVPRNSRGLTATGFRSIDGRRLADLSLQEVRLPGDARLGGEADCSAEVDRVLDTAAILAAAEAVGALEHLLQETAAYMRTRKQFGQPLSSFQALQHRVVDLYILQEEARGTLEVALRNLEAPAAERREAVALARIAAGRAGQAIGRQAIQLHGGIGMTDELRVGHLFKRLLVATSQYGDADWYRRRYQRSAG